jgi:hypothetical protein
MWLIVAIDALPAVKIMTLFRIIELGASTKACIGSIFSFKHLGVRLDASAVQLPNKEDRHQS